MKAAEGHNAIMIAIIEMLQAYLDEDQKLELQGSPPSYRLQLLRAAMHWKIKELERTIDHYEEP